MWVRHGNSGTLHVGMPQVHITKEETTKGGRRRGNEGVQAIRTDTQRYIKHTIEYVATTKGADM
jgi:hypothetical protein